MKHERRRRARRSVEDEGRVRGSVAEEWRMRERRRGRGRTDEGGRLKTKVIEEGKSRVATCQSLSPLQEQGPLTISSFA